MTISTARILRAPEYLLVVLNTMLGVGPGIDVETFIRIERDGGGVLSVLTLAELPK
jgi:hypothetical protein